MRGTGYILIPNLVVSGPAHHRDVPRKLRLFGQDRHPLCHLRRQRHGRRGRFEIRLLEGDKVAPRQAPEQPREHGKRAEMGREPGAVNKKSGPSEPLSRLRKNKKARQAARHKCFRCAKTLVHKQFICLCAVKCPTDTKTGAFAPCKHFAQQNLGGGWIHFHRAF